MSNRDKRYTIEVMENGTERKVYSDDPAVGELNSPVYDADYAGLATIGMPVRFIP